MYLKTILTAIVLTTIVTAQQQSEVLASVSSAISYENSVLASVGPKLTSNPGYSSFYHVITSAWSSLESQLATATAGITSNPTASASLSSYWAAVAPQYSAATQHVIAVPAVTSGAIASSSGGGSMASTSKSGSTMSATASATTHSNMGDNKHVQLVAVFAIGVLIIAVLP